MIDQEQRKIIAAELCETEPFASANNEQVEQIGNMLFAAATLDANRDVEYLLDVSYSETSNTDPLVREAAKLCIKVLGGQDV